MNDIYAKLDRLQSEIDSGDYLAHAKSAQEWGGADVIISSRLSDDTKRWLGDTHMVISMQETRPRHRAVITEYSRELSWLFYELGAIFSEMIDYVSKYDFYGALAQSAIDYLDEKQENVGCKELLRALLNKARRFLPE
jgi:hypothetical protein